MNEILCRRRPTPPRTIKKWFRCGIESVRVGDCIYTAAKQSGCPEPAQENGRVQCAPSAAAFGMQATSTSIISSAGRSRQGPSRCGKSHRNDAERIRIRLHPAAVQSNLNPRRELAPLIIAAGRSGSEPGGLFVRLYGAAARSILGEPVDSTKMIGLASN